MPAGEGQIGFFYGTIETSSNASGGFGDGLLDANPGEVALFSGPASDQSNSAPTWISLGSGGVPALDPPATATPVPALPIPALLMLLAAILLCASRANPGNLVSRR